MRWLWSEWGGRVSAQSRPRVANAGQAARLAQLGALDGGPRALRGRGAHDEASLGSAYASTSAAYFAPVAATVAAEAPQWRGHESSEQEDTAAHGATPTLLRATAQVAQTLGRAPEEVWTEALENWLASQREAQASIATPRARLREVRRQETWLSIDDTLQALRVS